MKKTILIAAVMLFALSTVAMAQTPGARFTVASTPETWVSCCGQTEKTGDIGFTAIPGTPVSVAGTFTITYAVPVTNKAVTVFGTGIYAYATAQAGGTAPVVTVLQPVNDTTTGKGVVTVTVAAGGVYPYTITLTGVRVDVSGSCAGSVSANITSTGNLLTSGETSVVVISGVKQGLKNPTATAVTVNGVTGALSSGSIPFKLDENFLSAFGQNATTDPSQTTSKLIRLNVSTVPKGVALTFPLAAGYFQLSASNGTLASAAQTVTNTVPGPVYYKLVTDSDPTVTDSLSFNIGVALSSPSYPLSGAPVTISAHFGPIDATGTVIPRYTDAANGECETAPVTVLSIYGASTTLLVPYATNMSGLMGYNTGLAIANTTTDPGVAITGFKTAVKQAGAITFYFYPQTGTPFTYATTAGSPGSGLNADGTLKTGGSYVVLLDQLLKAAAQPLDFTGYIFIVTNFTNAHGQYFISNFAEFTNGALMLVVNNSTPSTGRDGPESLNN